jgi:hypothetical protein
MYVYYAITAYFGATIVWGVYITSKAFGALTLAHSLWSNSSKTWEIRLISYAIYVMSATLTGVLIFSPYCGEPFFIHEIVSAMAICCGTGVAMSIKWLPKVFLLCDEKVLQEGSNDRAANSPPITSGLRGSGLVSLRFTDSGGNRALNPVHPNPPSTLRSAPPDAEIIANMPERANLRFLKCDPSTLRTADLRHPKSACSPSADTTPTDESPRHTFGGIVDKEFLACVATLYSVRG